jgi:hypothetical protein
MTAVGEDRLGAGEGLLLPAVDEGRVDAVVAGQFVDGPVPLQGGQGDLRLEGRGVVLSLGCQDLPFPGPSE